MRSSLYLVTFGLLGCVALPHAKLVVVGQGTREVVTGPVVCGPIGFRKVPLQSRWGEYVRVTVAAPSMITGTVLVHANGVAHEPRSWSTESGALVIDARFPNEDPDARFALERERPIDITLTGLMAPNGGTCEGAVFTVEQGALIPSVDERAWIAELERRGGPELAARRERARAEAEARRQAHYAAWEARQQVEVSATVVARAEVIRQAHYAQWELAHAPVSLSPGGERVGVVGVRATDSEVAVVSPTSEPSAVAPDGLVAGGSIGASGSDAQRGSVTGSSGIAQSGAVGVSASSAVQSGSVGVSGWSGLVQSGSAVVPTCAASAGGAVTSGVVVSGGGSVASPMAAPTCASGGSGVAQRTSVIAVDPFANAHAVIPGSVCFEASMTGTSMTGTQVAVPGSVGFEASVSGSAAQFAAFPAPPAVATVDVAGEWSQPSDRLLRAPMQTTIAQPSEVKLQASAQVQAGWAQPYAPRLDAVAVSTESQVASRAQYGAVTTESQVAQPAPCNRCRAPAPIAPVGVDAAALVNLMLHVGAAAAQVPAPVHGAQPVSR